MASNSSEYLSRLTTLQPQIGALKLRGVCAGGIGSDACSAAAGSEAGAEGGANFGAGAFATHAKICASPEDIIAAGADDATMARNVEARTGGAAPGVFGKKSGGNFGDCGGGCGQPATWHGGGGMKPLLQSREAN